MPVSKHNNLYFTAEQKALAEKNSNALQYALSHGYDLVRHGNYYVMKEHDSMVFKLDGSWFWNSRRLHGRAIEFIMHYEGRSLVEAILTLSGDAGKTRLQPPILPRASPPVPFTLPKPAHSQRQLFGYLCGSRKLDPRIVQIMLNQKILYQSDHTVAPDKTVHNACFISYDQEGKPCSAFQRGTATVGTPYKREVPGGNKTYGWILHGKEPRKLFVFEAAIDAASYASLLLMAGKNPMEGADYLALGGLTYLPIQTYLRHHPEVRSVHLMLDSDIPGRNAAVDFQKRLRQDGIDSRIHLPPKGKDWNEYLQQVSGKERNHIPNRFAKSPGCQPER